MVERDEVKSIERQMRELTDDTLGSKRERATLERAVASAKKHLEDAKAELPVAERAAKERRGAQVDAVRGRAELERRLADLVEAEALARMRRQQAEQRAQGFKAAAAFSGMARAEADAAHDAIRSDRERLVEERALREGATADARAAEELAEETRIGKLRAEVAGHVKAEREIEGAIASDREEFENRVAELRAKIERAGMELHEAELNLGRIDADRSRLTVERTQAGDRLREKSERARGEIEARIAELRTAEAELARERTEQEALLAKLIANEQRVVVEREDAERERAGAAEAAEAAEAERDVRYARETAAAVAAAEVAKQAEIELDARRDAQAAARADAAPPEAASDGVSSNGVSNKGRSSNGKPSNGKASKPSAKDAKRSADAAIVPAAERPASGSVHTDLGALLDFSVLGDYSDESLQAEVDAQAPTAKADAKLRGISPDMLTVHKDDSETVANYKRSLAAGVANRSHSGEQLDEQLIPGFKSFIGNIFTRAKPGRDEQQDEAYEEPPEGTSIADRIARDFGLLGGDPPAPPTA